MYIHIYIYCSAWVGGGAPAGETSVNPTCRRDIGGALCVCGVCVCNPIVSDIRNNTSIQPKRREIPGAQSTLSSRQPCVVTALDHVVYCGYVLELAQTACLHLTLSRRYSMLRV